MNNGLVIRNSEIHFNISWLEKNISQEELKIQLFEAYIIRQYEQAKLSIGEVAEILEVTTPDAMQWINNQGINYNDLTHELEDEANSTMNSIIKKLK